MGKGQATQRNFHGLWSDSGTCKLTQDSSVSRLEELSVRLRSRNWGADLHPRGATCPILIKLLFFPRGPKLQGPGTIPLCSPRGKQNWPFLWGQWASLVAQMLKILTGDSHSDLRSFFIV